jgi:hypothetical protein
MITSLVGLVVYATIPSQITNKRKEDE